MTSRYRAARTYPDLRRWNERLPAITGRSDAALDGQAAAEVFPAAERDRVTEAFEAALATGHASVQASLEAGSGDRIDHEFTGARLNDEADEPTCLVVVGRPLEEAEPARAGVEAPTS